MKPKYNSSHATEKFPYQINVNLTAEDMEKIKNINKIHFGDDASGSMIVRALIRKGMEWYWRDVK